MSPTNPPYTIMVVCEWVIRGWFVKCGVGGLGPGLACSLSKSLAFFLKAPSSGLGGRWVSDKQVRGVYLEWTVGTIGKRGNPGHECCQICS